MIAKNNPFNIRFSENNSWIGQTGQTKGFVDFVDTPHAVRAVILILRSYSRRGVSTIKDIITTFAPPTENNTSAYIHFVCTRMNYFSGHVINVYNPLDLYDFLRALSMYETSVSLLRSVFDDGYALFVANYSNKDMYEKVSD